MRIDKKELTVYPERMPTKFEKSHPVPGDDYHPHRNKFKEHCHYKMRPCFNESGSYQSPNLWT